MHGPLTSHHVNATLSSVESTNKLKFTLKAA